MIIYLADLSHTGRGISPNTVPLAVGYLSSYVRKKISGLEIQIFKDPNALLDAISVQVPDVVGFSLHLWSEKISSFCAQRLKDISPKSITVVGGPSVDDIDAELQFFLQNHPEYDVCIPGEGEVGFFKLIEHLNNKKPISSNFPIPGCATLSNDRILLKGVYERPDMNDVPSPYLDGTLDAFIGANYEPLIQTMRGCPYACTFCVSGTSNWSKLRVFSPDQVIAEFEYIKANSTNKYLVLCDENFGILKERDVAFAKHIRKSFDESNYPQHFYTYTAKIVTEHVLEIAALLSPLMKLDISYQTLNDQVIKNIQRTNMKFDRFLKTLSWARKNGVTTATEMIFGFPDETLDSYLNGIETLMRAGVDRIQSYNLKLLSGIDMSTQKARIQQEYKIMYRQPERCYGVYGGKVISETEEIVVSSKSYSFEDYLVVRKYGLFLEIASGCGYLSQLIKALMQLGYPGETLIKYLSLYNYSQFPNMQGVVQEYQDRSQSELFNTAEECETFLQKIVSAGEEIPEVKLNLIFTGRIMLDSNVRREFITVIRSFISEHVKSNEDMAFFEDYLTNILERQIVTFSADEPLITNSQTYIRIESLILGEYESVNDLLSDAPIDITLTLHDDALRFIQSSPISDTRNEALLQDVYMNSDLCLTRTFHVEGNAA